MKHLKIMLAFVGVMIVAAFSYDSYLRWRIDSLSVELRDRERLRIPRDVRIALTDGTAEGASKGVKWFEEQLKSRKGSIAALCLLDSLLPTKIDSLPHYREHGFCGNVSRWERYRWRIRRMKLYLENTDQVIHRYLEDHAKPPLRPFPRVDWTSLTDIQSKALSSIEAKNIGLLLVLFDGIADVRFIPQAHPSHPCRVRFARVGRMYDVQASGVPSGGIVGYELTGVRPGSLYDRPAQLAISIGDVDRDGLAGITYLQFETHFTPIPKALPTQPCAPQWEDLVNVAHTGTRPAGQ